MRPRLRLEGAACAESIARDRNSKQQHDKFKKYKTTQSLRATSSYSVVCRYTFVFFCVLYYVFFILVSYIFVLPCRLPVVVQKKPSQLTTL